MTQTITKSDYKNNQVFIYADYGQNRKRISKIFDISKITKKEALKVYQNLTEDHRDDQDSPIYLESLDTLVESIATSKTDYIWVVTSESGAGAAMEGVKEYHSTRKEAFSEAESQFC